RARGEDLERGWRAVFERRIGKAVAVREDAAVALVAHDGRIDAQHVAVAEPGAVEEPVIRAMDGVAAEAARDVATDAVVAATRERHTRHVVLGTTDDHV